MNIMARIHELEAEVLEQCRLNGMGVEREAKLQAQIELLQRESNRCRIELIVQIYELIDHIERASWCIKDNDMLLQLKAQREYALKVSANWNQNGNPFENLKEGPFCQKCKGQGGWEQDILKGPDVVGREWKNCPNCNGEGYDKAG